MAYRYLIYSTGTTFSGTIVRESATNNPGGNEAALYTDFIIPAIQPLYLWQVSAGTVIPNTDPNIDAYEISIAPAPQSKDNITYGEVTGITVQKLATAAFDIYSGATKIELEGIEGDVSFISGVTDTKLATAAFDIYSGVTDTFIKTKLDKSAFTGYTDSIKNVDKKIQVVSTSTASANTVAATKIPWNSAPVSADTYLWSGGTAVWIKSAGTYEVQYHVLLNNDAANQTHSIGGSLLKNGATEEYTSTAGMIIGPNMKAELSLPPAVLTLAVNDRLDLIVFRIGNTGNVNLVSGLVHLMLNKLT
jgi:hypothetical protein